MIDVKKSITYLAVFLIILVIYELCFNYLKSGHEIDYILKNDNLNEEEKTELALKYQILTDYTSLFA